MPGSPEETSSTARLPRSPLPSPASASVAGAARGPWEHPPGRARPVPAASRRPADRVGFFIPVRGQSRSSQRRTGPSPLPPLLPAPARSRSEGGRLLREAPRVPRSLSPPPAAKEGHPAPAAAPQGVPGVQAPTRGGGGEYLRDPRAAPDWDAPEGAARSRTQSPERPPRAGPGAPLRGAGLRGDSALEVVPIRQGCARPSARSFRAVSPGQPAPRRSGWTRPASLGRFQSAGSSLRPGPSTARAGHAGAHPDLLRLGAPSWTRTSISSAARTSVSGRLREVLFPKQQCGGGGQRGCREEGGAPHPPRCLFRGRLGWPELTCRVQSLISQKSVDFSRS